MSSAIKTAFASSVNHTITLASLASDSSLLSGRAGTAIDETGNLYLDELLAGFITTGTSPTASKEIDIYVYGSVDDTPTYPGYSSGPAAITGTDAAFAFVTANQLNSALKLVASIQTSSTTAEKSTFGPISVASLFGGILPKKWGVFVVHNTGVNLNSTSGNHQITSTGVYANVG